MGSDLVAVDATCARLIGLNPSRIPYLAAAGAFLGNVGETRIVHRGEKPERYRTVFDIVEPLKSLRS
jgi:hypothetical protein